VYFNYSLISKMTRDQPPNPYPWSDHNAEQDIIDGTELPQELSGSDRPDHDVVDQKTIRQRRNNQEGGSHFISTVIEDLKLSLPIGRSSTAPGKKRGLSGFFYPDGMVRSDDVVVFETQPTWLMDPKNHLIGSILMSIAVAITVVTLIGFGEDLFNAPLPGSGRPVPSRWWVLPLVLFFIGWAVYLFASLKRASTWYVLTQDRLLKRKGVLRRQDKRISLSDINKTHTIRPPHMYLFGVGHIDIFTAATSGSEARLEACQNISYRSELIDYQSKLAQMTPEERKKFAEQKTQ